MIKPCGFQLISMDEFFHTLYLAEEIEMVDRDHNLTIEELESDKLISMIDEIKPIATEKVISISDDRVMFKIINAEKLYNDFKNSVFFKNHVYGDYRFWIKDDYLIFFEEDSYDGVNDVKIDYYYIIWKIKKH